MNLVLYSRRKGHIHICVADTTNLCFAASSIWDWMWTHADQDTLIPTQETLKNSIAILQTLHIKKTPVIRV